MTNRPAIANSWYDDYCKFIGTDAGYQFVSEVDALKGKPYVLSREEYTRAILVADEPYKCIEFVSLQDLKGSVYFGGIHKKLKEVRDMTWDILIIDEAHEGVDTPKTDIAFDRIRRKYTLHLSGTPFKALANDKFPANAIYNWTYADEQRAKEGWESPEGDENPYATLPKLNMYTYQMSEIIAEELSQGIEINGETEEYAFDLNEFFATNERGFFVHNSAVDRFLDAMTTQEKFPFSTDALRDELRHTFWLLNRVESARALAKKLAKHPVFKDYNIVLAAGDGKIDDDEERQKSFDKVRSAISRYDKTITLSVGQLTTGVTIPEWTAVLMLSSIRSPALYMQAAFRSQNPCLFKDGHECFRKENAYVKDGVLHIRAQKEDNEGQKYTSARMLTKGKFAFKYGTVEARIALPTGKGIWPAFWMLGENFDTVGWPACGEIDIIEAVNSENKIYGTNHWANGAEYATYGNNTGDYRNQKFELDITQFHTYKFTWDEKYIRMFVDDFMYHEILIEGNEGDTEEFHKPFFFLLNVAVAGNWPGFEVDDSQFPNEMLVDYIRVGSRR